MLCVPHTSSILCGCVIQSVGYISLCSLIVPCEMSSLLPCHCQPVRWICCWGLFLAGFSWGCTEPHGVLSPGCCCLPGAGCWASLTEAIFRSSLMAGGVKRGVTNPWLLEESEETRGLGFDELRQQQRRIIEGTGAFLVVLSVAGTWEEPLFEPQYTNLCWSFIIYRWQTQQLQAAGAFCFLYLQEQHCACNVLNWLQLLKLNFGSPDFAHIHGFGVNPNFQILTTFF